MAKNFHTVRNWSVRHRSYHKTSGRNGQDWNLIEMHHFGSIYKGKGGFFYTGALARAQSRKLSRTNINFTRAVSTLLTTVSSTRCANILKFQNETTWIHDESCSQEKAQTKTQLKQKITHFKMHSNCLVLEFSGVSALCTCSQHCTCCASATRMSICLIVLSVSSVQKHTHTAQTRSIYLLRRRHTRRVADASKNVLRFGIQQLRHTNHFA